MDDRDLELLSAYLDGALNEGERQTLETRLAHDALLQRELDRLGETKRLVEALPTLKAPRDLTIAQPARQGRRQPLVLSPWVSTLSAVAAAFMLIAGFVLLNRTSVPHSGQEALSQTAISLAATPEAAQLRAVPTAANGLPAQTATAPLTDASSVERAQAQENQAATDETSAVDGQTGAAPVPALAPAPGSDMPLEALAPVAPSAVDG
ncbi:MAG: hypothetical protein IH587_08870, partial [Anaerolineae bacterium]|nr:hypothetical protein [Anaerolineae bacterium]